MSSMYLWSKSTGKTGVYNLLHSPFGWTSKNISTRNKLCLIVCVWSPQNVPLSTCPNSKSLLWNTYSNGKGISMTITLGNQRRFSQKTHWLSNYSANSKIGAYLSPSKTHFVNNTGHIIHNQAGLPLGANRQVVIRTSTSCTRQNTCYACSDC